jgi:hypothetical protein
MPTTLNGIVYTTSTMISQSQSISGSFIGFMTLASGSTTNPSPPADFVALKDVNNRDVVAAGHMYVPAGVKVDMLITSASLHATSAPVMFFY